MWTKWLIRVILYEKRRCFLRKKNCQTKYLHLCLQEEFEDTKGTIIIRISKKNRQHNGKKKKVQKEKQRSTKHAYKTKDRVTRTSLKTGGELSTPER
jgi:hypothetical protein